MGGQVESSRDSKTVLRFDFPREVTLYRRIVHTKDDFERWWQSLDNASDAYMTVYGFRQLKEPNYRRGDYQTAIVPNFVLDFDCQVLVGGERHEVPPSVPLEEVRRLHNKLVADDIAHGIWFSGGGFHVWVKLSQDHLPSHGMECSILKGAGRSLVRQWANELHLNCIDPTVTFDLASLIRVPNSYNVKRGLWSIPLRSDELLEWDWERIQNEATNPRTGQFPYGSKGLDIDTTQLRQTHLEGLLNPSTEIPTITMGKIIILPCLQASSCRDGSNPTHDARFHLASYLAARLRDFRPPQTMNGQAAEHTEQIVDFIRSLNWVDFNEGITRERTSHIVNGPYHHTPCWSMFNRGYCVGKCNYWDGTGTIPDLNTFNKTEDNGEIKNETGNNL